MWTDNDNSDFYNSDFFISWFNVQHVRYNFTRFCRLLKISKEIVMMGLVENGDKWSFLPKMANYDNSRHVLIIIFKVKKLHLGQSSH